MMQMSLLWSLALWGLVSAVPMATKSAGNKLLLISFDGFRWDYLDKTHTPNFDRLVSEGSKVRQVTNAFATLTMPNHYTLVTGLSEEEHGIIANRFFDPDYKEQYSFSTETKWYNSTEPIWITAEREGKKAGAYMWIGNQAEFDGVNVTKVRPYISNVDHEIAMEVVIDWLATDDLDFVCLYIDEPDGIGHEFGPNSDELKVKVRQLDLLIGLLIRRLEQHGLTDRVNIVITSDHGMTDVSNERSINLGDYVDFKNDVEWYYASAIGLIIPKPGKLEQVFANLTQAREANKNFQVYKKADIPDRLHYKNNSRITPIVLVADTGYLMKSSGRGITLRGNHGFDNTHPDMKTMMIGRGPDFKCGYEQAEMRSVDLYPLMCRILGLQTCHGGPGEMAATSGMVNTAVGNCLSATTTASITGVPLVTTTSSAEGLAAQLTCLLLSALVTVVGLW